MTHEAAKTFVAAADAMGIILSGLMEWSKMLAGNEEAEALFHIGKTTHDFRALMTAVNDWTGVKP